MNVFEFIPEHLIDENIYVQMDMIQTCYDALDEGVVDQNLVTITRNNTLSLALSFLDTSYKKLCEIYDIFTSHLNNYILNYAKLAEKYKSLITDMYSKINEPITYNTFTYPKLKEQLPKPISNNANWYNFIREAQLFGTDDANEQKDVSVYFNVKVDNMLQEFTRDTLGQKLDTKKLTEETKTLINVKMKGPTKTIGITQRNVGSLIDGFTTTAKEVQKEIKATKTCFAKDYKTLQELLSLYQKKKVPVVTSISMIRDPEKYDFELQEMKRFSNINMEMSRLYTGLVSVYNVSYTKKYEVLRERVELDRVVLVALLQAAGSFAAINNKTATKQSQPLKRVEPIDKFML